MIENGYTAYVHKKSYFVHFNFPNWFCIMPPVGLIHTVSTVTQKESSLSETSTKLRITFKPTVLGNQPGAT